MEAKTFEIIPADCFAEIFPEPGLDASQADQLAVRGLVGLVVGIAAGQRPFSAREIEPVPKYCCRKKVIRVITLSVYEMSTILSPARPFPGEKGWQYTHRSVHGSAGKIGQEIQRDGRRLSGPADQIERTGNGDIVDIMSRILAVGAVLPVAAERAVDDARVDLADRLVVDAHAFYDPGTEAFHDNIGIFGQPVKYLLCPAPILDSAGCFFYCGLGR